MGCVDVQSNRVDIITPPITEILCVKNGWAIMVCGFLMKVWLDWLCYLAGNSQTAPTIFFQTFRRFF